MYVLLHVTNTPSASRLDLERAAVRRPPLDSFPEQKPHEQQLGSNEYITGLLNDWLIAFSFSLFPDIPTM